MSDKLKPAAPETAAAESALAVLDALPAHVAVLDRRGRIVSVNHAWRAFADANTLRLTDHGVGSSYLAACEGLEEPDSDLAHAAAAGIRAVLAGAVPSYSMEYPCHSPAQQRWFQLTATPLKDGGHGMAVVMHLNITEQRLAKDRLHESDRRLRSLLDNMDLIAVMLDREARITYCNDHFLRMSGWTAAEVMQRNWFDLFIPPEQREELGAVFSALIEGEAIASHYTNDILVRGGRRRTIHWNNSWLRSTDGAIVGSASIGEDITWRRESEDRQRSNEERYLRQRNALIALADQAGSRNLDGALRDINETLADTLGVARCSVWRYNDDHSKLCLADLFSSGDRTHVSGMELHARDYPAYFDSLSSSELIAADDACLDPQTREFEASYLKPLGIGAMLDAPIRSGGRVAGVLCAEHVGGPRLWTADEKTLVVAMANQVSLALEADARRRAQDAIALSGERMRATLASALDSIIAMDASGGIIEFNPAAERAFGHARSDVIGRQLSEVIIPPEHRAAHERGFRRYLETGTSTLLGRRVEMPAMRADGGRLLVELAITVVGTGRAAVFTAFLRDITELRRAAAEVEASEDRFRELADNIDEVFWLVDVAAHRILYVSPAYERVWGRKRETLYARTQAWAEAIHPADRARVLEASLTRQLSGEYNEEYRIVQPDGSTRWIKDRAFPICGKDGTVVRVGGVAQDITARKQAETELSRQNRALQMLSACNEALVRAKTEAELLAKVCRIAVEIGGYRMAWVGYVQDDAQRSIRPMAHAGAELGYLADIRLSLDEGSEWGSSVSARAIRGSEVVLVEDMLADPQLAPWREAIRRRGYRGVVSLPLLGDDRTFGVLTLFSVEPAPVGVAEIKLLQELADNLALGIANLRSAEENDQLHDAVLRIAQGVSAGFGRDFFELLMRSVVEATQCDGGYIGLLTHGNPPQVECRSFLLDGQFVPPFSFPLAGTPTEQVVGGELCLFESSLSEHFPASTHLIRAGLEAYAGVPLRDSQGKPLGVLAVFSRRPITRCELVRSALRIFAIRATSEMQRQLADLHLQEQASLLDEAHDAIMVRGIDERIRFWNRGAERLFGWTAAEAAGRSIEELLCPGSTTLHGAVAGVMQDGVWGGDVELKCKDGRVLTVAAHWTLVRDEDGRPKSILCINTDITRRVAMERQLHQSQRLEAVGQLTGGVAHDFNNLLTVILGNAEMLTERLADYPRLNMLAGMIRDAAQRGADLTAQLLAFARRQKLEPRVVDVNRLLAGMEGLLRRTLREDIELTVVADAGLWNALVDSTQLEGAVLNLCINARDAMDRGGQLLLETANITLDGDSVQLTPDVQPGEYVMVAVTDNGHGIAADNLKRVFEPFFTTKEFGKGTGLGLSMVYGFIKQSQGHVSIYSEIGHGTTVKMFLPRAGGRGTVAGPAPAAHEAARGTEKVLLAEDDDMVRQYAQDQLAELGYRVVAARNGAEALAYLETHADIDLLFTDVVMPGGINGPELAEAARRIHPGLAVLFTSGYTDNAIQNRRLGGEVLLLNKPYRRVDLARKLREALGARP